MSNLHRAFRKLITTLDALAIPYMIGGSLASSVHGILRSTNDNDIVAAIREEHVAPLVANLTKEFHADSEAMLEALRLDRPFNLIHFASGCKFDIFPAAGNPTSKNSWNALRRKKCPSVKAKACAVRLRPRRTWYWLSLFRTVPAANNPSGNGMMFAGYAQRKGLG
jgi:hypothetical protein